MKSSKIDLSIFNNFNFERVPIGIKYHALEPQNIERLDKKMALCEMLNEAVLREASFYASRDNEDCVGVVPMGWEEIPPLAEAGHIGPKWGIHKEARANAQVYIDVPRFSKGVNNYIEFASLEKINFDPDILFVLSNTEQAEIIFRAMSYTTGALCESKFSNVLACAYLFAYPYRTGKINFIPTGIGFGTKTRKVFPEGMLLIAIPFQWLQTIVKNLEEMPWVLEAYKMTRGEYLQAVHNIHLEIEKESGRGK